jgi:hypothetical protein
MSLRDYVQLLKSNRTWPLTAELVRAAEKVMSFLDGVPGIADIPFSKFPRGYYYDIGGSGTEQLCLPRFVDSVEEGAAIFARDVADGFLEELCNVLDEESSRTTRTALGL